MKHSKMTGAEVGALAQFYESARLAREPSERLHLLATYAVLELPRQPRARRRSRKPKNWNMQRPTCWVCGCRAKKRHHVIALEHGGSNHQRNLVPLCTVCEDRAHGRKSRDEAKYIDHRISALRDLRQRTDHLYQPGIGHRPHDQSFTSACAGPAGDPKEGA